MRCPALLGIPLGSPAARTATLQWTGILTSLLLVGWAIGGILFGRVADRIGRTRTLLLTMLMYALGTAACAFAPNIWRARAVPHRRVARHRRRVGSRRGDGGRSGARASARSKRARCSTPPRRSACSWLPSSPSRCRACTSPATRKCRGAMCFCSACIPAAVAFVVRLFVKEPERWQHAAANTVPPRIRELFTPEYSRHHDQRASDGGGRAHHLVELQCVYLGGGHRPGRRGGGWPSAGAGDRRRSRAGRRSPATGSTSADYSARC